MIEIAALTDDLIKLGRKLYHIVLYLLNQHKVDIALLYEYKVTNYAILKKL